jgi:hypothetical protein
VLIDRLATIGAIDHHAHLLAGPDTQYSLADLLTESEDPGLTAQLEHHPVLARARRDLAELLEVEPEGRARALIEAARIDAMFVDDGFSFDGALSLDAHAAAVGCPVRRIVRIETEAEAAAPGSGWPPFADVRERFVQRVRAAAAGEHGAVGLKTIAAYRCGLDLPVPSEADARAAYERWRAADVARLTDPALVAWFIAAALDATEGRQPLQVHVGLGDKDLVASRSDPFLLQRHFDGFLRGVPVVLLHCYPFVRHAGYLASVNPDVYVDLSLSVTLMPHRAAELILEALELAPATKLLYATDASRRPEVFYLATRWWRRGLAGALGRLVDDGELDLGGAVEWARLVLAANAARLYGVADLSP